jgi:hypothetical protein
MDVDRSGKICVRRQCALFRSFHIHINCATPHLTEYGVCFPWLAASSAQIIAYLFKKQGRSVTRDATFTQSEPGTSLCVISASIIKPLSSCYFDEFLHTSRNALSEKCELHGGIRRNARLAGACAAALSAECEVTRDGELENVTDIHQQDSFGNTLLRKTNL